ncbi:MAG: 5'-nucleotidase C-terminal domain-containing protein [Christensenellaceae bacterium]|jgi:5'-nucleotidase/UDP-sugar diphosphatase
MKKKLVAALLAIVLVLSMGSVSFAALPEDSVDLSGTVAIIHTNDTHGHIDDNMGFTAVRAMADLYAEAGATVLLLDAGDVFQGMPSASLSRGEDIVSIINAVGYDAATTGNHDFDYGWEHLLELAGQMEYPIVCANVLLDGEPLFEENILIERDGLKFGIFGVATPDTSFLALPSQLEGVTFTDPSEAAQAQVELLMEQDADYIIALSHLGVDDSSNYTSDKLAADVPEIDLIIDGHSHTEMEDGQPLDGSELDPHEPLIASTGAFIENVGVVTIGKDGTMDAKIYNGEEFTGTSAEVDGVVADINEELVPKLEIVVGETPVLLNGEREDVRIAETNLGDFSADSLLAETGADMALMNGGNIRASIQPGEITRGDVITVFPFGNYIVTLDVTGQDILDALELGVSEYPNELGGFPQVAGVQFKFDENEPAGRRVFDVKIGGQPLEPGAHYSLATNDYLADGGDNYTMLASAAQIQSFSTLEEAFTNYLNTAEHFPEEPEGRIVMELLPTEQIGGEGADDAAQPASAQDGETYTVKPGDSLWKIAKEQLGDGYRWPEIYELNRDQIADPNGIDTGWELALPAA